MGKGGGGRADEDEDGNPVQPEPSPESIKSLGKYVSKTKQAEKESETPEDQFRNMRVGGNLDEPSDDEVGKRKGSSTR